MNRKKPTIQSLSSFSSELSLGAGHNQFFPRFPAGGLKAASLEGGHGQGRQKHH